MLLACKLDFHPAINKSTETSENKIRQKRRAVNIWAMRHVGWDPITLIQYSLLHYYHKQVILPTKNKSDPAKTRRSDKAGTMLYHRRRQ